MAPGHVEQERADQRVVGAMAGRGETGPGAREELAAAERPLEVVVGARRQGVVRATPRGEIASSQASSVRASRRIARHTAATSRPPRSPSTTTSSTALPPSVAASAASTSAPASTA